MIFYFESTYSFGTFWKTGIHSIIKIQLTCSWHQKTKPRIHQFTNLKCCRKAREPFKTLINGINSVLFLTLKKHFQPCFFILKALKDILQHFKFVNWWIGEFVVLFFWCHEQVKHHMFSRILNLRIQIFCFLKIFFVFFFDEVEVFDWDQNRPKMTIKLFILKKSDF